MVDPIDRQALSEAMYYAAYAEDSDLQKWENGHRWIRFTLFENVLKGFPSVDTQQVRHGHWIETPTSPLGYTCSECGKEMCRFNYCPYCGTIMDGDRNETD